MNEPNPPPLPSSSVPKTSAMAVWSLVLGILSLTCFTIFSAIPAVICGHKALSRIKRSGGALEGQGIAIGGLVTGYMGIALALLIIPVLAIVAIPNFARARAMAQKNFCVGNLQYIEAAKQTWAMANKKQPTDVPTEKDLAPYLASGMPHCIAGGTYSINAMNQSPTCSIPEHKLE
jgi:competence protein ComGC